MLLYFVEYYNATAGLYRNSTAQNKHMNAVTSDMMCQYGILIINVYVSGVEKF